MPLEHAGSYKPPAKIFLSVRACNTRDTRAFERAKKGLVEKNQRTDTSDNKRGEENVTGRFTHPLVSNDATTRYQQPPRKPICHFQIPKSGCSICGEPENAFAPCGHGFCQLCFLHIREVASWTGSKANFCPHHELRKLYDMVKSASYITGGDSEDRVPYLKHSVLDMLVDNIFTVPPPGKRGSIYGEDLDGRYVKITAEEAAKEKEYERGAKIFQQPAIKLKMTKFVVERMGFRYGVQLAWRAWVLMVWESRVRKFLQKHPNYERRTPYKLLTQVFGEWIEMMRERQESLAVRHSWTRGQMTRKRRIFKMKRILGIMHWGYIGPMLQAFRNLAFNVGFDMLEEIWKRAFLKDPNVKDMAKKAAITCFDSIRVDILAEEALSRWFQYYKAARAERAYEPPLENGLHSMTKNIFFDVEMSRAAFDAAKEGILSEMMAGGGFNRHGTLQRLLTSSQDATDGATPQRRGRGEADTPEKTAQQAGANVKFAR